MENRATSSDGSVINDQKTGRPYYQSDRPVETGKNKSIFESFAAEGCEDFYTYTEWIGLINNPKMVLLSSSHHYYYHAEDLKEIETVVNLKQLNHIKQIKDFLKSIYQILPQDCYFIGCFFDNNNQNGVFSGSRKPQYQSAGQIARKENGITSNIPFLNTMYNIMDSRTNRNMTKKTVRLILKEAGFKVLDMTELNGLTYFCTQKGKLSAE